MYADAIRTAADPEATAILDAEGRERCTYIRRFHRFFCLSWRGAAMHSSTVVSSSQNGRYRLHVGDFQPHCSFGRIRRCRQPCGNELPGLLLKGNRCRRDSGFFASSRSDTEPQQLSEGDSGMDTGEAMMDRQRDSLCCFSFSLYTNAIPISCGGVGQTNIVRFLRIGTTLQLRGLLFFFSLGKSLFYFSFE